MKRLIITLATAVIVASPILTAPAAYAGARDDRRGGDRDDRRGGDRDDHRRWDDHRDNGYYLGNRWYYGPPPVTYYDRGDFRLGYHAWARGDRLPRGYPVVVVNDYRRYNLRRPPRGYHWVRANNGDFILAAIATGLILELATR